MAKEILDLKGHIILYCKNHYTCPKGPLEGLRMIWAIRCGYPYTEGDNSCDKNIAKELYSILVELCGFSASRLQEIVHEELAYPFRYLEEKPLAKLIYIYRGEIINLQIKEKVNTNYRWIIKLPKPNKRVFNRILRGNGRFNDYKLINN